MDIFRSSGGHIDPSTATIAVGTFLFAATCLSSWLNNRAGRRPVLVVTECVMAASLAAFGAHAYLSTHKPGAAEASAWLPLASLATFIVAFRYLQYIVEIAKYFIRSNL